MAALHASLKCSHIKYMLRFCVGLRLAREPDPTFWNQCYFSPGDPGSGKGQQKLGDVVQGQSHHPVDRGADHEALPGHEKI